MDTRYVGEKRVCDCCGCNAALLVSGIVFALIALLHLYRYYHVIPVVIGTTAIPLSYSLIAFIIFGVLAVWLFVAFFHKCRCDRCHMKDERVIREERRDDTRLP